MMKTKKIAILSVCLFAAGFIFAQPKPKKTTPKKKTSSTESVYNYVDSLPLPARFKNESVVILGQYEKMRMLGPGATYTNPSTGSTGTVSNGYSAEVFLITRYLLQDQNAVEKFATYHFYDAGNSKKEITIIKKDGTRIIVDLSKAIPVKSSFSSDEFSFSYEKYRKIAMPGLEVGDMIEFSLKSVVEELDLSNADKKIPGGLDMGVGEIILYGYFTAGIPLVFFYPHLLSSTHPKRKKVYGINVPDYTYFLNSSYPVVKKAYDVSTDALKLPFEYSLANGAPKPEIKTKDNVQTMHIEVDSMDKVDPEYFFISRNNIPNISYSFRLVGQEKYTLTFGNGNGKGFDDDAAQLLTKKLVENRWRANAISTLFDIEKEMGSKLRKMSSEEKLRYMYYYVRKNYGTEKYIESKGESYISESSLNLTKLFQLFCDRYDIPYEILLWQPRKYGPVASAVNGNDLRWGVLAKPSGKQVYLTDFDALSEYNVPHQAMYGCEVYYVDPSNNYSIRSEYFEPENERNQLVVTTTGAVLAEGSDISLKSEYSISGELKNNNYHLVTNRSDFVNQYQTMLGEAEKERKSKYLDVYYYSSDFNSSEKQAQEEKRLNATIEQDFTERENDKFSNYLSGQYNVDATVNKVDVENHGLSTIKSKTAENIEFKLEYTLEHVVAKVGNNALVMDLGRLMTEQLEIKEISDRTRKYKIDVDYQKSFDYTISLEIPQGFNPVNLKDFNASTTNDMCSFEATCKFENGKLVFHCLKKYKKVQGEAKDWSKVTDVMDMAANMFQKKLLLEKAN